MRDAAAKAKLEAEALSTEEGPLHDDNEWNIRCLMIFIIIYVFHFFLHVCKRRHKDALLVGMDSVLDVLNVITNAMTMQIYNIKEYRFLLGETSVLNFQCS